MTKIGAVAEMRADREMSVSNNQLQTRVKTIATLLLLLLVFPLNLILTTIALLRAAIFRPLQPRSIADCPQTILISGGK